MTMLYASHGFCPSLNIGSVAIPTSSQFNGVSGAATRDHVHPSRQVLSQATPGEPTSSSTHAIRTSGAPTQTCPESATDESARLSMSATTKIRRHPTIQQSINAPAMATRPRVPRRPTEPGIHPTVATTIRSTPKMIISRVPLCESSSRISSRTRPPSST